jgi:hypothetical protein
MASDLSEYCKYKLDVMIRNYHLYNNRGAGPLHGWMRIHMSGMDYEVVQEYLSLRGYIICRWTDLCGNVIKNQYEFNDRNPDYRDIYGVRLA